jgi:hypothetical protein
MSPSEFHSVPVPTEDLEAVYELIAERSRARRAVSSASASGAITPTHGGVSEGSDAKDERSEAKDEVWTEERLARVAQGDTITTRVLTDIMDVIARDPRGTHEYNQECLVEETGHSAGRVKATFTKLTPHFRKHYGTDWWPIMADSGATFKPARSGMYYWMTPTITDRWKRIRNL